MGNDDSWYAIRRSVVRMKHILVLVGGGRPHGNTDYLNKAYVFGKNLYE